MDFSLYHGCLYFMVFKTEQVCLSKASLSYLCFILLMPIVGYWHAWQWYFKRVFSSMEEAIGLIAIFAFMVLSAVLAIARSRTLYKFSLWPVALLLVIYSVSFVLPIPPIIRAAIAFITLFVIIYWSSFGAQPPVSFWALVLLSLPVVPSLQFYLGYPARLISASISVPLLQLNGVSVSQSGANLIWRDQLLQFDAPCSGITMLWAGLFVTLFMSLVYRFNFLKTSVAIVAACIFVLFGNVLRASSLFYLEMGVISFEQPWLHEGIGVAAFLLVAAGIVIAIAKFQQWSLTQ